MKLYSIIANCQGSAIQKFLESNSNFNSQYKLHKMQQIQDIPKNDIDNFFDNIIPKLDLIIIQPISDNYKNYHKYSTKSIINRKKENCKIIMFPSIYFTGYYPNLINDNITKINIVVHDINLIKTFLKSKNKLEFIENSKKIINDPFFYNKKRVEDNVFNSLLELKKRENKSIKKYNFNKFIKLSDFIKNNYNKQILAFTLNHFSRTIFIYITNNILNHLNIKIQEYPINLDPQKYFENCILYNSVKQIMNPKFSKEYFSQREISNVNLDEYLSFHYDKYLLVKDYLLKKYK